jgi:hypothetical protein
MLLAAATQVEERRVPVYLVSDEFQRMVASNLEYMLQLARSMGVGVILANQSMEDLKRSTTNLIPAVEANCRLRQWFSVSSIDDQKRLMHAGGVTVDQVLGETITTTPRGQDRVSSSSTETVVNRITVNDISLTNDHPFRSFLHLKRSAGYAQFGGMPLTVQTTYHISEDEYRRRKALRWPRLPGSFVPNERRGNQGHGGVTSPHPPSPPGPTWGEEEIGKSSDFATKPDDEAVKKLFDEFRQSLHPQAPNRDAQS